MNATKVKILDAAREAFTRYGVRRVNMGDVADAAEVSRQTLYAHYKNKDALTAATMTAALDLILEDIRDGFQSCDTLAGKLDAYFEHGVRRPFAVLQKHPDLKDLLHGVGQETTAVAVHADVEKARMLADQFTPFAARLNALGRDPAAMGTFVVRAATEFKYSAKDAAELEGLLQTLRVAVLAMVGEDPVA